MIADHNTHEQVRLASELSEDEFQAEWKKYEDREGISQYPEILKLFSRQLKEASLERPRIKTCVFRSIT